MRPAMRGFWILVALVSCAEERFEGDAAPRPDARADAGEVADAGDVSDAAGMDADAEPPPDTGIDAGCMPESDPDLCDLVNVECGTSSAVDRCGMSRNIFCGGCMEPLSCGARG